MRRIFPLLTLLILLALLTQSAHACPYCADTIHNNDVQSASSLGSAFNISIYCMFMGLAVAFGIVVRTIVKGIRE
ncbi:MAG TPA: hypothetical protein VGG19_08810 [Tepidisphaeraceae bacterium]|jgi:hypothetical protein